MFGAENIKMENLAFNRTIVELKQRYVSWYDGDIAAFNRTIVELKPSMTLPLRKSVTLLIEPLWN